MKAKRHNLILTILIIYTALILFFLFFSFGRFGVALGNDEYRFNLIPSLIHLRFPPITNWGYFQLRFFELGNFIGFMPFGILIPMLYRCNFFKFISFFFLSILIVETVQMLTFLGSFDINDAIVNSLGAAVGFFAYKIGSRFTNVWKELIVTAISLVILATGVIGVSELLNKNFTKIEGPITALNELETNGSMPIVRNLPKLEVGHEEIQPEINLYSNDGDNMEAFTYNFDNKDIVLLFNYGIPDNATDSDGEIVISVNGKELETYSNNDLGSSELIIEKVNELTITINGHIKLWDVAFKEMNYWWN